MKVTKKILLVFALMLVFIMGISIISQKYVYGSVEDDSYGTVVKKIELVKKPAKLTYNYGEKLDLTGGIIRYTRYNGTVEERPMSELYDCWISKGLNSKELGVQIIEISSWGDNNSTVDFTVEVLGKMSDCTIYGITDKVYTGNWYSPSIKVKYNKNGEFLSGVEIFNNEQEFYIDEQDNYIVEYKNNRMPGKATVTIKAHYGMVGTITKTFIIRPKKVTGLKSKTQTIDKVYLSWSKAAGVTGYEVYKYDTTKKKYVKIKTTSKTSYNVSGLKSGTSYKFKVRAYKTIDGKKQYGDYSDVLKKKTIKKIKINTTKKSLIAGQQYNLKLTGTDKKIKWTSSNSKVVAVNSKGKITAKKSGTATITARVNGKKYKCKVTAKGTYKRGGITCILASVVNGKPYIIYDGDRTKTYIVKNIKSGVSKVKFSEDANDELYFIMKDGSVRILTYDGEGNPTSEIVVKKSKKVKDIKAIKGKLYAITKNNKKIKIANQFFL